MTQKKIDDLFSLPSSSRSSNKRSRINAIPTNDRDEFDDIFETKRQRTNKINNNSKKVQPLADVFDFDSPLTSTSTTKTVENNTIIGTCKVKRQIIEDDDENKAIDELFNNDKRKKIRSQIKQEESMDVLDLFKPKTNINVTQTIKSTIDDFKMPISSKHFTTQNKVKMFFDDSDLLSIREQVKQENDTKDYIQVKPVLVTGGQWLSKEAEIKSTCETNDPSDNSTNNSIIPNGERNLMHIHYAPLVMDDDYDNSKKSKASKNNSVTSKSNKQVSDGKSFRKQLVLSDSTIVRKDNLQSCYNALLEDLNKPRVPSSSSSSNKSKPNAKSKVSQDNHAILSDEEEMDAIDFFDQPLRKKKF